MNDSQVEVRQGPRLHLGRVLMVVVPVTACMLVLGWVWGYYDLGERLARWRLPPLVPVTGRIYLNGVPLAGAQLATQPVGLNRRGAIAETDAEGRFALRTDVDGDFWEGAYAGEHRVIVWCVDPNVPTGPFKPPTVTPPESESFETTPLRIFVDRDPNLNQVVFRLEYKAPPRKVPPKKGGPGK